MTSSRFDFSLTLKILNLSFYGSMNGLGMKIILINTYICGVTIAQRLCSGNILLICYFLKPHSFIYYIPKLLGLK